MTFLKSQTKVKNLLLTIFFKVTENLSADEEEAADVLGQVDDYTRRQSYPGSRFHILCPMKSSALKVNLTIKNFCNHLFQSYKKY